MADKIEYYSLDRIKKEKCLYNVIFGERSAGKTFQVLLEILRNYKANRKQGAILRRMEEDFKGKRARTMFDGIVEKGFLKKIFGDEWTDVAYISSQWFLSKYDKELEKRVYDSTPFAYAFALSSMEHDKSTSYPNITTIMFDEFLTRGVYLQGEFELFQNVCSTIIREREDVTIYMLGNTVRKSSLYFEEMGLYRIEKMQPGQIEVYQFGEEGETTVAVEWTEGVKTNGRRGKKSDKYFAFNNPHLRMITNGAWELSIYPHLPIKYSNKEIIFTYFICFARKIYQCEIIDTGVEYFTYIHRKTTELKNNGNDDIVFTSEFDARPNYYRRLTKPVDDLSRKLYAFFVKSKVFYQTNEVGEEIRDYLQWSTSAVDFA